eukprot:SAG11_NODE_27639_length_330_cov_1.562771_1_plen_38_part_10
MRAAAAAPPTSLLLVRIYNLYRDLGTHALALKSPTTYL